ncbi:MAG: dTMP kinase [Deltaproteobacteria bacterium]|nr:dTMP kinase [Deltaproteobacteria bacterium]
MLVVFEGIDGSGKTTLSNRVASLLPGVRHVRQGGELASSVASAIRQLARDSRNLLLTPRAELFLYLAREIQLFEEVTLPAVQRGDLVIADRFIYAAEVLASRGRGLPEDHVVPAAMAAVRTEPDLVVLVDVHPQVARARRRVRGLLAKAKAPTSRKGLAGIGMHYRLRDGYLELAERWPERWLVVDNSEAHMDSLVSFVNGVLLRAQRHGVPAALALARESRPPRPSPPPVVTTPAEAKAALLSWVDRATYREPHVAACFLAGLHGEHVDERRENLAGPSPEVIAWGLKGMADAVSARLRLRLVSRAPGLVARSLAGLAEDQGNARWLFRMLAPVVPEDVAAALDGRDDPEAWRLRAELEPVVPHRVVASLKRMDTPQAWELRERLSKGPKDLLSTCAGASAMADSVTGLDDERSWAVREAALLLAPVDALASLDGIASPRAFRWREKYLSSAPRVILCTLSGMDDPRAWDLREAKARTCKEVFDSMVGLDGARARRLREDCADTWPSTVVKSLGPLARAPWGRELLTGLLSRHAGNLSLWKHAMVLASDEDWAEAA